MRDYDYLNKEIDKIEEKIRETKFLLDDDNLRQLALEELKKLEKDKSVLEASFSSSVSPSPLSPFDQKNVILEVRGAAGGEEAKIWAEELLRMYLKYSQKKNWKTEQIEPDVLKITGKGVFGKLKYEAGVHRVQRIPATESGGRIHTSTATVAVLPELEEIDLPLDEKDLEWQFFRSGGHGGQNVNKVSTAVRLKHKSTGLTVTCQTERQQNQNRQIALELLRAKLWEQKEEEQLAKLSLERKAQIGRGMRAEKIRTYNFLQDRITDHRLDKSFHNIEKTMEGEIEEIISLLQHKFAN